MSAEMPKMPEPVGEAFYDHVHKNGLIERRKTHIYTAEQMRAYAQEAARQAMERAASVIELMGPPPSCDDPQSEAARHGAKACAELVRALIPHDPDHLAGVGNMVDGKDQSEKRHG